MLDSYKLGICMCRQIIQMFNMKYVIPTQATVTNQNLRAGRTGFWSAPAIKFDLQRGRSGQTVGQSFQAADPGPRPIRRRGESPALSPPLVQHREDAGLSANDLDNLPAVIEHEFAANTMRSYRGQWKRFSRWAQARRVSPLPAAPAPVAAYLAERIELHQHKPATVRVAASAIAFVHRAAGQSDPCSAEEVKRTLRGAGRKRGRAQRQARPLTDAALDQIRATACLPRRSRGGRHERAATALSRGLLHVALISLMRDAMLRVSEAAALTWEDVEQAADGRGRLLIRRSKTEPEGEGAVAFISSETMAALNRLHRLPHPRGDARVDEPLFGLRPNQIATRIAQAAQTAGLGTGFSGHSPRIGMTQDLARAGTELTSLMTAGRWRSSAMRARYTRNESAARGAVAQFYAGCPRPSGQDD